MTDFKLGKRAPKNAPALMFAHYLTNLPSYPPVDYLPAVDWSQTMNGNDRAGDCVACGIANTVHLISQVLTGTGVVATLDEVITFYKTQNPGFDINGSADTNGPGSEHDGGMDEQTACEELVANGITIGGHIYKALGFMKVDHANLPEIKAAISVGGSLLFGVVVDQAQQDQFPNVWDYVEGSPEEGGHCIVGGGHIDGATDVKAVCWASEFGTTDAFLSHQLDEAWLIIWPWHIGSHEFISGMDVATFAADVSAITGEPFPVPVPAPNPAPVVDPPAPDPAPVPDPSPSPEPTPAPSTDPVATFLDAVPPGWELKHHEGDNERVARAVQELRIAVG